MLRYANLLMIHYARRLASVAALIFSIAATGGCVPDSTPIVSQPLPQTSRELGPLESSPAEDVSSGDEPQPPAVVSNETSLATPNLATPNIAFSSWPNWMGPNHDGISNEDGWSSEWPETGLPVVWSREIGIGFSSISIEDGRLFTMGHVDGEEFVYCLQADTGEVLWSKSYPCALVDNLHDGGPGATPTIDGEYIYTLGREGQLFCFRTDNGETVWEKDLQQDLGVAMPEWGFTSSAYILGPQLILEAGRVVSYDKTSGAKNWETEKHNAGYGSAIPFVHEGNTVLATLDCEAVRITDSTSGREIASYRWDSPFLTNSTTPIVREGAIYISTGYQIGCGLFQLKDDRLELIYSNRQMRNHFNNSIYLDGYVYGFDGNSNLGRVVRLNCMEFSTGKIAWKQKGLGCGSLMIAGGKLLILSENGTLVLANATPDGFQELARSPFLEGRCWTVPVLLRGRVYGRNAHGTLVCVKLPE